MNQTAICNLALLRLGIAQSIADITESSTPARACNAVYTQCLESMLHERPWPFAVRQVDLALVGTQLIADWFYTYRYPSSYLNVHRVLPTIVTDDTQPSLYTTNPYPLDVDTYPFALGSDDDGRLIHTDMDDAIALGTVLVTDTSQYPPLFNSALAWYIAAEIAVSLTKDRNLYGNAYGQYEAEVSKAFAIAANEPKPRPARDADMIQARE
jgi:hypothetical protein